MVLSDILNMTADELWHRLRFLADSVGIMEPVNIPRVVKLESDVISFEIAKRVVSHDVFTEHAIRQHDSNCAKLRYLLVNRLEAHANYRIRFNEYRKYMDEVLRVPKYAVVDWDDMLIENQEAFAKWCDAMDPQ